MPSIGNHHSDQDNMVMSNGSGGCDALKSSYDFYNFKVTKVESIQVEINWVE
jgi:hypothetical protein